MSSTNAPSSADIASAAWQRPNATSRQLLGSWAEIQPSSMDSRILVRDKAIAKRNESFIAAGKNWHEMHS
jgi:hypothetical protein